MEGQLLWVGSETILDAFVLGTRIPASVIVLDQYDNRYPSEVTPLGESQPPVDAGQAQKKVKATVVLAARSLS